MTSQTLSVALLGVVAALLAAGCSTAPASEGGKMGTGVNSTEEARWTAADEAKSTPPTNHVPEAKPGTVVQQRERQVIKPDREPEPGRPAIDVRSPSVAVSGRGSAEPYTGPFRVERMTPTSITGVAMERDNAPIELHYQLPEGAAVRRLEGRANLQVRDLVDHNSLQRRVLLSDDENAPVLVYIAEGSDQPYRATFRELRLTIEQGAGGDEREESPPVTVTLGEERQQVKAGSQARFRNGAVVQVMESSARPARQTLLTEGQRYYVRVLIYAAGG